jgi:hypothetical protein
MWKASGKATTLVFFLDSLLPKQKQASSGDIYKQQSYWNLKAEALDSTLWRTCLGRRYEPVV